MNSIYHFSDRELKVSEIAETFDHLNKLLGGHRTSEGFSVTEFKIGNESVVVKTFNLITPIPMYFKELKESEEKFIEELILSIGPANYIEFTDEELLVASYLFVKNGESKNATSVAQLMSFHYTGNLPKNSKLELHRKCEEALCIQYNGEMTVNVFVDSDGKAHDVLLAKDDNIQYLYQFLSSIEKAGFGIGGTDCFNRLREGFIHDKYIDPYTVASYCYLCAPDNSCRYLYAHAEWVYYLTCN